MALIESAIFRAPSTLKLVIEILVFVISLSLGGIGILFVLLLPLWVGLVYLMGRRTTDAQYVDVTPEGVTITSPSERLFLPAEEIDRVRYTWPMHRLMIKAGRRRIKLRGVLEARKAPIKVPFRKWLADPPPARGEIRAGMAHLKQAIEGLITF